MDRTRVHNVPVKFGMSLEAKALNQIYIHTAVVRLERLSIKRVERIRRSLKREGQEETADTTERCDQIQDPNALHQILSDVAKEFTETAKPCSLLQSRRWSQRSAEGKYYGEEETDDDDMVLAKTHAYANKQKHVAQGDAKQILKGAKRKRSKDNGEQPSVREGDEVNYGDMPHLSPIPSTPTNDANDSRIIPELSPPKRRAVMALNFQEQDGPAKEKENLTKEVEAIFDNTAEDDTLAMPPLIDITNEAEDVMSNEFLANRNTKFEFCTVLYSNNDNVLTTFLPNTVTVPEDDSPPTFLQSPDGGPRAIKSEKGYLPRPMTVFPDESSLDLPAYVPSPIASKRTPSNSPGTIRNVVPLIRVPPISRISSTNTGNNSVQSGSTEVGVTDSNSKKKSMDSRALDNRRNEPTATVIRFATPSPIRPGRHGVRTRSSPIAPDTTTSPVAERLPTLPQPVATQLARPLENSPKPAPINTVPPHNVAVPRVIPDSSAQPVTVLPTPRTIPSLPALARDDAVPGGIAKAAAIDPRQIAEREQLMDEYVSRVSKIWLAFYKLKTRCQRAQEKGLTYSLEQCLEDYRDLDGLITESATPLFLLLRRALQLVSRSELIYRLYKKMSLIISGVMGIGFSYPTFSHFFKAIHGDHGAMLVREFPGFPAPMARNEMQPMRNETQTSENDMQSARTVQGFYQMQPADRNPPGSQQRQHFPTTQAAVPRAPTFQPNLAVTMVDGTNAAQRLAPLQDQPASRQTPPNAIQNVLPRSSQDREQMRDGVDHSNRQVRHVQQVLQGPSHPTTHVNRELPQTAVQQQAPILASSNLAANSVQQQRPLQIRYNQHLQDYSASGLQYQTNQFVSEVPRNQGAQQMPMSNQVSSSSSSGYGGSYDGSYATRQAEGPQGVTHQSGQLVQYISKPVQQVPSNFSHSVPCMLLIDNNSSVQSLYLPSGVAIPVTAQVTSPFVSQLQYSTSQPSQAQLTNVAFQPQASTNCNSPTYQNLVSSGMATNQQQQFVGNAVDGTNRYTQIRVQNGVIGTPNNQQQVSPHTSNVQMNANVLPGCPAAQGSTASQSSLLPCGPAGALPSSQGMSQLVYKNARTATTSYQQESVRNRQEACPRPNIIEVPNTTTMLNGQRRQIALSRQNEQALANLQKTQQHETYNRQSHIDGQRRVHREVTARPFSENQQQTQQQEVRSRQAVIDEQQRIQQKILTVEALINNEQRQHQDVLKMKMEENKRKNQEVIIRQMEEKRRHAQKEQEKQFEEQQRQNQAILKRQMEDQLRLNADNWQKEQERQLQADLRRKYEEQKRQMAEQEQRHKDQARQLQNELKRKLEEQKRKMAEQEKWQKDQVRQIQVNLKMQFEEQNRRNQEKMQKDQVRQLQDNLKRQFEEHNRLNQEKRHKELEEQRQDEIKRQLEEREKQLAEQEKRPRELDWRSQCKLRRLTIAPGHRPNPELPPTIPGTGEVAPGCLTWTRVPAPTTLAALDMLPLDMPLLDETHFGQLTAVQVEPTKTSEKLTKRKRRTYKEVEEDKEKTAAAKKLQKMRNAMKDFTNKTLAKNYPGTKHSAASLSNSMYSGILPLERATIAEPLAVNQPTAVCLESIIEAVIEDQLFSLPEQENVSLQKNNEKSRKQKAPQRVVATEDDGRNSVDSLYRSQIAPITGSKEAPRAVDVPMGITFQKNTMGNSSDRNRTTTNIKENAAVVCGPPKTSQTSREAPKIPPPTNLDFPSGRGTNFCGSGLDGPEP